MHLHSLNYLLKNTRNRHNRSTDRQWQTSHITYYWQHWCSQWFDTQSGRCTGHTWDRQGNWHFVEVSGSHHTQRHSAKVPEEMIEAWSEIQQSIIDQLQDCLNACQSQRQTLWTFVVMCLSITVNLSWRLLFALLWLWTDWHMLCLTR